MKAAHFACRRPSTIPEALQAIHACAGAAKFISGSQSLGPMLNLRLARPPEVVDLSNVAALKEVRSTAEGIEIGAAVTHSAIEDGLHEALVGHPMQSVAAGIAYRAIRNRGTVGGSLAHADPAADWVVTLQALGARLHLRSIDGERILHASDFMVGAYTTVLQQDEVILAVVVPAVTLSARWGYYKLCRKPGEFAEASAAVLLEPATSAARIVLGAVDGPPIALDRLAKLITDRKPVSATRQEIEAAVKAALASHEAIDHRLFVACVERALEQAGLTIQTERLGVEI